MDDNDDCAARDIDFGNGLSLRIKEFTLLQDDAGAVVWDAGLVLSYYLAHRQTQGRCLVAGRTVLELGSGTGVVGLTAARLGAADVRLTDLPHLVPYLRENIQLNGLGATCRATQLNWSDPDHLRAVGAAVPPPPPPPPPAPAPAPASPPPPAPGRPSVRPPDLVLASDVVYTPATRAAFFAALAALLGLWDSPQQQSPLPPPTGATPPQHGDGGQGREDSVAAGEQVQVQVEAEAEAGGQGRAAASAASDVSTEPGGSGATGPYAILCFEQRPGVEELPGLIAKHGLEAQEVPPRELHPDWRCAEIHVLVLRRRAGQLGPS